MKICIVYVLYNKKIDDITSLSTVMSFKNSHNSIRVIVLDNSTIDEVINNTNQSDTLNQVEYVNNHGNIGLSKSYNVALRMVEADDWIIWMDDDTFFSYEYLCNLYDALDSGLNVISGRIYTDTGSLLSPIPLGTNSCIENDNVYIGYIAINSGLCVKRSVYDTIGFYDEELFLDMIDYWFFAELNKHGINQIAVVNGEVVQSFSGSSNQDYNSLRSRYQIYRRDFIHYCKVENKSFVYKYYVLIKRKMHIYLLGLKQIGARHINSD